jgi:hypothetical protein
MLAFENGNQKVPDTLLRRATIARYAAKKLCLAEVARLYRRPLCFFVGLVGTWNGRGFSGSTYEIVRDQVMISL